MRARNIILISGLLICGSLCAQNGHLRRGDRSYEALSYFTAIEHYETAFSRGAKSIAHARRLADCHWQLRDQENAAKWYSLVALSNEASSEDIYRYAELLRTSGSMAESDQLMIRFRELSPSDSRGWRKSGSADKIAILMDEAAICHKVEPVSFNSEWTDMTPFIHNDQFFFSSARTPEYLAQNHHTWNDQPFLNLYSGSIDANGDVSEIKPLRNGLNTSYHESNAIISADGTEMFFTRNMIGDAKKRSSTGINNLQLYTRTWTDGTWSDESSFAHNLPDHNFGHPAMTRDGKRLYFVSDMPGGEGGKDIWICERDGQRWSAPVNAGPQINTEGDEMFPYIHGNFLYFASDGHLGFGGLDLFRVRMLRYGNAEVQNLGMPINGPADDFGICLDRPGDIGFFTSDRGGGIGGEDLYIFRMHSKPEEERVWHGRIMDEHSAKPIPHVQVRAISVDDGKELARAVTSAEGTYEFPLPASEVWLEIQIPGGAHQHIAKEDMIISRSGDSEMPDVYLDAERDLPFKAVIFDRSGRRPLDGARATIKDIRSGATLFHGHSNKEGSVHGFIPDRSIGDTLELEIMLTMAGYLDRRITRTIVILSFDEHTLTDMDNGALTPITLGVDLVEAMGLGSLFTEGSERAGSELAMLFRLMELDRSVVVQLDAGPYTRESNALKALSIEKGIAPERIQIGNGTRGPAIRIVDCSDQRGH